ncbi:macrolide family glycosyltransferase [Streptomyces sp. NPDC001250]|uniref:macrolide family glycosyltransferase n=1 Tax=unclassified Streptomyces TaxID=2593676 RepID=UPI003331EB04
MSLHLLFMSMPQPGHVFPNLAVIEELVREGHRVSFATGASLTDAVGAAGATALPYDSVYDRPVRLKLESEQSDMALIVHDDGLAMLAAAESALTDDRPDAVLYDTMTAQVGRVLAEKWGLPSIQLNPMFASNEKFNMMRALFTQEESDAAVDNVESVAAAMPPEMQQWFAKTTAMLVDNGIETPLGEWLARVPDFGVVYLPQAFQYAGELFDERFAFVGPCLSDRGFLGAWQVPDSGLPVVLVSLGTIVNDHPEFFKSVVQAFTGAPFHVVITVGKGVDLAALGPLPANVEAHAFVPHLTVLEYAQVCVTHGGMGGVMEAMAKAVPLVVVPQSYASASIFHRVEELGLGRVLDAADFTSASLRKTVEEVAGDERIRANVRDMQRHIQEAGGARRAAREIENHLRRVRG